VFGVGRSQNDAPGTSGCHHEDFDERNDIVVVALWVLIGIIAVVGLVLTVSAFVALAKQ
jgi:hypothetical protein